jgi:hypothetical protein
MWDSIKHQGEPTVTIGGGLALGFAMSGSALFQWPTVEIDTQVFVRGLRYHLSPDMPRFKIDYNPMLFNELEREHASTPFSSLESPPDVSLHGEAVFSGGISGVVRSGDPRLLDRNFDGDDAWLLETIDTRQMAQ